MSLQEKVLRPNTNISSVKQPLKSIFSKANEDPPNRGKSSTSLSIVKPFKEVKNVDHN